METNPAYIYVGETIHLQYLFVDLDGNAFNPTNARANIVRNYSQQVSGPYSIENGTLTSVGVNTGIFEFDWTPPGIIVPGTYMVKWEGSINEEDDIVFFFTFQVLDPPIEPGTILDPPRTVGIMRPSATYHRMGLGQTDRLFLVGHANGLVLNDPYPVVNMKEAINILGGDFTSPMVRALLEAYNTGCRDIWLVAAAPQSEYIPFDPSDEENRFTPRPDWGGLNFYERYELRLETTYGYLEQNDLPEIVCLIEAPFYDTRGVDFLTPLKDHCASAFLASGVPRIAILGTRVVNITDDDVAAMIADSRLTEDTDGSKFVCVIVGEGIVSVRQMPVSHMTSLSTVAAAALAVNVPHQGLTWRQMPNVVGLTGLDLTKAQIKDLANVKLNPCIRTEMGKRGTPFQIVVATDNTLSADGSDYWSLATVRLVLKVINGIKLLGQKYIGSVAIGQFKQDVVNTLGSIQVANYIRGYQVQVLRSINDPTSVIVDVMLQPYTTVREVLFTTEVGPGG